MGGVESQQVTTNTYRIVARGNAYTGGTQIQDYTLLKAAETTRAAGGTHFMIVSSSNASRTVTIVTLGQATTTAYGNGGYATATTTYTPAMAQIFIKPGQDAYIQVITVPIGQSPPPGAFSADEIIQFIGSRVKRG